MSKIEIDNPRPGSSRFTSRSRAARYISRKEAEMIDGKLRFVQPVADRVRHSVRQALAAERSNSDVYVRGGFVIAIIDRWSFPHTQWSHGDYA